MANERKGAEKRQWLLEGNSAAATAAIRSAIVDGSNPSEWVVAVLDLDDPLGKGLAMGLKPDEYGKYAPRPDTTASLVTAIWRQDLAELSGKLSLDPRVAAELEKLPPSGCFSVCCVADGGVDFFTGSLPMDGRSSDA